MYLILTTTCRTAGAFSLDLAYGLEIKSPEDPYIIRAEQGMFAMSVAGTAAAYVVDFIPSLKFLPSWLPGVKFKSDAKLWRPYVEAMAREPFKFVEEGLVSTIQWWNTTSRSCY